MLKSIYTVRLGSASPPESPSLPKRLNFTEYFVDGSTKKNYFIYIG